MSIVGAVLLNLSKRLIHDEGIGEVCRLHSITIAKTLVLLTSARRVQRNLHSSQFLHHRVEPTLHLLPGLCEVWIMDEVVLFLRIGLNVEQLIRIPEPVVRCVLVLLST